ncbi:type VI secretion system tube protein Hcp [Methylomicrobium sp. Wu6]|uniref:Hcp family type VI secretion system effector n=1 Tax=Methylomicrobium sp. Wu6 TaxID=3107928 RepID=UPI002DD68F38|nr:type VI secretion system tube protein Hcp [Methylomicrobium sp. Wu6]MEC4748731.1 type VI secretion system tube protein Hcp [Methylomicrobium sp. Wu6]
MAVDMFINMGEKIKGETKDAAQKAAGDIDILAWSWGMSQSGSFHIGGGGGAGKVNIQDISITKWVDKATPAIMLHCCGGTHIPQMVLLCRKAGETQQKYIEITLKKCIITSVSTGGSGGEDRLTENVSINFAEVKFEYFMQDDKGVTASAGVCAWNIEENVKSG